MNKKHIIIGIIIAFTSAILFFIDGFDLLGRLGLKINTSAWNIFVVVVLYYITYVLIDRKSIKRKENQEKVAIMLIKKTYDSVTEHLNVIELPGFHELIIKKISGDDLLSDNKIYNDLTNTPFNLEGQIFEFAKEGVLSGQSIRNYTEVKRKYDRYLSLMIAVGDNPKLVEESKNDIWNALKLAKEDIEKENNLNM